MLCSLILVHQARAASCSSTLTLADTGSSAGLNFQSCNTFIQPGSGSGWSDTSAARWAGMQTSSGHSVRGIFNCGLGVSNGSGSCSSSSATTITTSNAVYSVTGSSATSTLTFTLVSRNSSQAFTDNLTYYTYVGSAVASPADSVTNTPYTIAVNVAATGLPVSVSPSAGSLTSGTTGSAWSNTFTASGGTSPYTWTSTALPTGLSLNAATGMLSGTPGAAGNFTFSVTATDSSGASDTQTYSLQLGTPPPVANAISATVASGSTANVIPLNLSGGAATSVNVASVPLHGSVTSSGLILSYTPVPGYAGVDTFTYTATSTAGTSAPATVTITVLPASIVLNPVTGTVLPAGTTGAAYTYSVSASGGTAPFSWSAAGLPAGLSMGASTGVISGVPDSAAVGSAVSVTATDSTGATATATYTLSINAQLSDIVITPATGTILPDGVANEAYAQTLTATGGSGAYTWSATGLPAGLNINTSTGKISGTPLAAIAGTSVTVTARDSAGMTSVVTYRISIRAAFSHLVLTPTTGTTLVQARAGESYTLALAVTGGIAPYAFSASGLPDGITIDAQSGKISGTPTHEASAVRISVTVRDASGFADTADYLLTITGALPHATDRTISLYAGQHIAVSLSQGASGGPFTGATLITLPSSDKGVASLSSQREEQVLIFTSLAGTSGPVSVIYTLTNQAGTSSPATLTFLVSARSNPAQDPEVIGLLNAQLQSAEAFANAQITNFNQRLEQLHREESRQSDTFNVDMGLTQSKPEHNGSEQQARNSSALNSVSQYGTKPAYHDTSPAPLPRREQHAGTASDLVWWTGGFVDFGTSDNRGIQLNRTLAGLSTGADYRFTPSFVAGVGLGFGRDRTDTGSQGTKNNGEAFSSALYGSFHTGAAYLDLLAGYSQLSFDSHRFVTDTAGYADGNRDGTQFFSSVSAGYEFQKDQLLLAPYVRLQLSDTKLKGFTERGADAYSLYYKQQHITYLSPTAGLRSEYRIPLSWGGLMLHSRIEYAHAVTRGTQAQIFYADTLDTPYSLRLAGLAQNTLTTGVGVDFIIVDGISAGIGWQGNYGLSEHTRYNAVMYRMNVSF